MRQTLWRSDLSLQEAGQMLPNCLVVSESSLVGGSERLSESGRREEGSEAAKWANVFREIK